MDPQHLLDQVGRTGAGHAALGRDAELGKVPPRRRRPLLYPLGAVARMHQAQEDLGLGVELQPSKGRKKSSSERSAGTGMWM